MTWPSQQIVEGGCYQPGWYLHPGHRYETNSGTMSTPTTPGWYPNPSGQPGQRYHDGERWTKHVTPTPPPMFAPAPTPPVTVAVSSGRGTNHALHLILKLLSCGLMTGGVALGLVVVGEHPWLLVPLFLLAGGVFFWKPKTTKDAKKIELREQYRRDVVADRADYEDELWRDGDPRGTHGRYPPPTRGDLK
jgi:Protein of unknown function (DUF2510)